MDFWHFGQFWRRVSSVGTGSEKWAKNPLWCLPNAAQGRGCHLAHGQLLLQNAPLRNLSEIGTTQTLLGNMSNIDICWKPWLSAKNTFKGHDSSIQNIFRDKKTSLHCSFRLINHCTAWITDSWKFLPKVWLYYAKRNGTTALLPVAGVDPLNIHIKVSHLGGCDTRSAPIFARGMGGSLACTASPKQWWGHQPAH